ncbi:hypothetical protein K0U07_06020 [bacterium]|nr:hypothetical protein [bacterium]
MDPFQAVAAPEIQRLDVPNVSGRGVPVHGGGPAKQEIQQMTRVRVKALPYYCPHALRLLATMLVKDPDFERSSLPRVYVWLGGSGARVANFPLDATTTICNIVGLLFLSRFDRDGFSALEKGIQLRDAFRVGGQKTEAYATLSPDTRVATLAPEGSSVPLDMVMPSATLEDVMGYVQYLRPRLSYDEIFEHVKQLRVARTLDSFYPRRDFFTRVALERVQSRDIDGAFEAVFLIELEHDHYTFQQEKSLEAVHQEKALKAVLRKCREFEMMEEVFASIAQIKDSRNAYLATRCVHDVYMGSSVQKAIKFLAKEHDWTLRAGALDVIVEHLSPIDQLERITECFYECMKWGVKRDIVEYYAEHGSPEFAFALMVKFFGFREGCFTTIIQNLLRRSSYREVLDKNVEKAVAWCKKMDDIGKDAFEPKEDIVKRYVRMIKWQRSHTITVNVDIKDQESRIRFKAQRERMICASIKKLVDSMKRSTQRSRMYAHVKKETGIDLCA